MTLLSASLCLVVIACDIFAYRHGSGIRPRVIHGVDDDIDEYPYVMSLQYIPNSDTPIIYSYFKDTPTRTCTGSLITDKWVITASHCFAEDGVKITLVRYGNMALPANSTKFFSKILKTIVHPSFQYKAIGNQYHVRNDIGLLLVQNIPVKYYGRLSAIDYNTLTGLRVRYAGFGTIWSKPLNRTNAKAELEKWALKPLQIANAAIVKCDKSSYKTSGPFICIVPPCANKRQVPAPGDSGGPLLVSNKIVGVLYGYIGGIHQYTPVSPYLDWINVVMSKEK